jgi:hypothetical protein
MSGRDLVGQEIEENEITGPSFSIRTGRWSILEIYPAIQQKYYAPIVIFEEVHFVFNIVKTPRGTKLPHSVVFPPRS